MTKIHTYTLRTLAGAVATTLVLALASCGSDDNNGSNSGSSTDVTTPVVNVNANTVTTEKAVSRYEFPALHTSGNQKILVQRLSTTGNKTTVSNKTTTFDPDAINFCTEWDCDKRSQRWTCYQMHQGYNGEYSRVADFTFDPQLKASEYYSEYTSFPGYQRGHICPSADRTFSQQANTQTFYMSNMQPQYKEFNSYDSNTSIRGMWLRMENHVQTLASRLAKTDTMYICKGGTIDKEENIIERIGGKLIVPRYFFMAILRKRSTGWDAMGFFVEQTKSWRDDETLLEHARSIDDLEELTGLDFFCNLPDDIENAVESTFKPVNWNLE